jgi:hypothetical protein
MDVAFSGLPNPALSKKIGFLDKIFVPTVRTLVPMAHRIYGLALVIILGIGTPSAFGELLHVEASRWVSSEFDLTKAGGNPTNGYLGIRYNQSIILWFSGTNDASWGEIILPNNPPYPLEKTTLGATNDYGFFFNSTNALVKSNAVLVFSLGGSFNSWQDLNEMVPANQTYTVRFGGGVLGTQEGVFFLQDDLDYLSNPPWVTASDSSLAALAQADSSAEMNLGTNETGEWQITLQDSRYHVIDAPFLSGANALLLPANTFQPGLTYLAMFYRQGPRTESWSFGNYTRLPSPTTIPLVAVYLGVQEMVWFQTRAPRFRLRGMSTAVWNGETTRLNVEVESNANYTGLLEFTENLGGGTAWTAVTNPVSFGTNGTSSLTLEKTGDFRGQWDRRLFFRVRNQRPPVESPDFMPVP